MTSTASEPEDIVSAEMSDDGKYIEVFIRFSKENVEDAKKVAGWKFIDRKKSKTGVAYWRYPLDFGTALELRTIFGERLNLGKKLRGWGHRAKTQMDELEGLASADDAELDVLPKRLPELYKWMRAYQRADTKFLAVSDNPLNANQQRLGKTVEVIGSVFEAKKDEGMHLVVCPSIAIENVWQKELERWQDHKVYPVKGGKAKRQKIIDEFVVDCLVDGKPGWLLVNPQMVSYRRVKNPKYDWKADPKLSDEIEYNGNTYVVARTSKFLTEDNGNPVLEAQYEWLFNIPWDHVIVDECHKGAIRNPNRLSAKAMYDLPAKKRIALSGTPMTRKGPDLWGTLHYLHPDKFTNKWKWLEQWFDVKKGEGKGGRTYLTSGRPLEHRKEDFYKHLTPYVLRRTLIETRPELADENGNIIDVQPIWVRMSGEQQRQYAKMAADAEVKLADESISATSLLAELVRLKQFAIAKQTWDKDKGKMVPTFDSCKLKAAEEIMDELDIFAKTGTDKVVIASQFREVVLMVNAWLATKKVKFTTIHGGNKKDHVSEMNKFQNDSKFRVCTVVSDAGGVAIDLSAANYGIMLDEKWSHADQEQMEFRLVGQTPETAIALWYYIRTKLSVDQDIMEIVSDKRDAHEEILDRRRQMKLSKGGAKEDAESDESEEDEDDDEDE